MGSKSKIEWTDASWNPIRGCTRVSEGCRNCYAEMMSARFSGSGLPYEGVAKMTDSGPRWTGAIRFVEERLEDPLRWQKGRKIFVCSMSDLFHEAVRDDQLLAIFSVMERADRHIFQVLTKRPERMRCWVSAHTKWFDYVYGPGTFAKKFAHVWFGTSVENQEAADRRIPILLETPATVRWLSIEPLLGPLNIGRYLGDISWIVVGGESGQGARPMHPDWVRSIRDQCVAAGVPFFFKQWGEWRPYTGRLEKGWEKDRSLRCVHPDFDQPQEGIYLGTSAVMKRAGKTSHGNTLLEGHEWKEFPKARAYGN